MNKDIQELNFIRSFATFLVVLLHVSALGCYSYGTESFFNWITAVSIDSFARVCVPLFLIISGFLNIREGFVFKKRALKILMPLIFWNLFYQIYILNFDFNQISLKKLLVNLVAGPGYYHLWFLYSLIGLYLLTPILNALIKSSVKLSYYLLAIWFFYNSIYPVLDNFFYFKIGIPNYIFGSYFGYYLLGGILYRNFPQIKSHLIKIIYFLSLLITIYYTAKLTIADDGKFNDFFFRYEMFNVFLMTISLFYLFFHFKISFSPLNRFINYISENSFGIYLIHLFFYESIITGRFGFSLVWSKPNGVIGILNITIIVFFVSLFSVSLLRKIKFFRYILG